MSKTRLGEALRQYCWQNDISTRDLAADWDCSHTTVARLLQGKPVAQATFIAALAWLTVDLDASEEDEDD